MPSSSPKLRYHTPAQTSIANYHDMFGHNCFGEGIVNRIAAEIWCSWRHFTLSTRVINSSVLAQTEKKMIKPETKHHQATGIRQTSADMLSSVKDLPIVRRIWQVYTLTVGGQAVFEKTCAITQKRKKSCFLDRAPICDRQTEGRTDGQEGQIYEGAMGRPPLP